MGAKIDRGAFEGMVREHHAGAYRAALRVVRDEALALDAVQQTFLSVLEGRVALAQAADPGKLLRCVAARQAAMLLRSEGARARREAEVGMRREEEVEAVDPAQAEARRALRSCLAQLPDELRLPVVLRFQESLTLAEIGEVLEISPPSVHGRLERAAEKLRERMSRLGFAAVLPRLPEFLAHDEPASVPPQALPRLLALTKSTLTLATLVPVASVLLLAVAGAVYVLPHWLDSRAPTAIELASEVQPPRQGNVEAGAQGGSRVPVQEPSRPAPATAALAEGRIEGQVRDELGFAVEGAELSASSVERDGKFATWSRVTRSARDGSFELSLPVGVESGQDYALSARTPSLVQQAGVIRVRSGQTAPYQRIQLFAPVTDRPGAWQIDLLVRDPAGRPVPRAVARIHHVVTNPSGASWLQWQAGGQANESGELALRGEGLGTRLLTVDAREQGFAILRERVELGGSDGPRHEVVLQKGLAIRGTILDEHGAPLDSQRIGAQTGTPLYAFAADPNEWFGASFPEPGRFEILALAPEPHELHFQSERWSPFSLHALRPGAEPLELQLKLKDDPADVGLHDAEIHARLADAATHAPIQASTAWTWLDRIDDASPALQDGDFAPLLMQQVIVQTADGLGGEESPPAPAPDAITCAGLEPGRYALRVRVPGYAPALLGPIELGPREISSGQIVRLARGALVRGVVLDGAGHPLAGARVLALGSGALSRQCVSELDAELRQTAGRGTIHSGGVQTDAEGRFQLANVPVGLGLRLFVLHPEHLPLEGGALQLAEGQPAPEQLLRAGARRER
jgi:RNA polymerase sigma-70 factor (ECF subfamily)